MEGEALSEIADCCDQDDIVGSLPPLQLSDESSFIAHPWVAKLIPRLRVDSILAQGAMRRLTADLKAINDDYASREKRSFFTSIDGRVKTESSFIRKLYALCKERAPKTGITERILLRTYRAIKDLAGVRFACPYYDEIEPAIVTVRTLLCDLGYATNLKLHDKNHLDKGDERGYRSYHFYVNVPTPISIFGDATMRLCEVQVRSELQHIWAVKSHDLLYKLGTGWFPTDGHVLDDMKQLSNSLRAADQALVSVRDRARGGKGGS